MSTTRRGTGRIGSTGRGAGVELLGSVLEPGAIRPPLSPAVVGRGLCAWCLALLACTACAGPLMQHSGGAHQLYRESGFGRQHLREGGVGFIAPSLSVGQETLGHALVPGLFAVFDQELPDANVVAPNLVASRINETGLSSLYAEMMRSYDRTGILERDALLRIAQAMQARYVAVPILVSFHEETNTRLSALGFRIAKTATSNTRVQLEIWDAQTGRIVWEGLSDSTLATELLREQSVHFERAVQLAWEDLIKQVPTSDVAAASPDRSEAPAPAPALLLEKESSSH